MEDVERQNYFSPYIQDVWKVNRNLTINAGVRWDPYFPLYTKYNHVEQFNMVIFWRARRARFTPTRRQGCFSPEIPAHPGIAGLIAT